MLYSMSLCAGRHTIPGTPESIFPGTANPLDQDGTYKTALAAIPADCTELSVYVTGLTVAMLTVVKVCLDRGISLTALHFDRDSNSYYEQAVVHFDRCPYCGSPMLPQDDHCPGCGA